MKNFLLFFSAFIFILSAGALEKLPLEKVRLGDMLEETQLDASDRKDHIAFVWVIFPEYWATALETNLHLNEAQKEQLTERMKSLIVVAVVEGDVTPAGTVAYYDKSYLERTLKFHYVNSRGERMKFDYYKLPDGSLAYFYNSIAPVLSGAIGGLGENFNFFIFSDLSGEQEERLIDPYKPGKFEVELKSKANRILKTQLDLPLNSLFVPRLCPNGKPAHVSWKYCPWTGTKLPE